MFEEDYMKRLETLTERIMANSSVDYDTAKDIARQWMTAKVA